MSTLEPAPTDAILDRPVQRARCQDQEESLGLSGGCVQALVSHTYPDALMTSSPRPRNQM